MKATHFSRWLASLALGLSPFGGLAQTTLTDLEIAPLRQNGQLTFLAVPGYTNYSIEWAPTVNGPWNSSWDQLRLLQPVGTSITVSVPMFYRVAARGAPLIVPPGMVYVPRGEFLMGDVIYTNGPAAPLHTVLVSALVMDRFEVTKALWEDVAAWAQSHGYQFESAGSADATNHPIAGISWYDAVKWCNARSEKEGLQPAYYIDGSQAKVYRTGTPDLTNGCVNWTGSGYRLPTEAEWEKSARGGLANQHYAWENLDTNYVIGVFGKMANFWNSGDPYDNGTTPVGFYDGFHTVDGVDMRNGFGLYDMAGNVAEFCWDRVEAYSSERQEDPLGPDTGDQRIVRGGSWYDDPEKLRLAVRRSLYLHVLSPDVGFRCVRVGGL
jgi:sulfatase modifying factor 1